MRLYKINADSEAQRSICSKLNEEYLKQFIIDVKTGKEKRAIGEIISEATEADINEAGYVKREEVGVYYDGLMLHCCNCDGILDDNINYCPQCGSELNWKE